MFKKDKQPKADRIDSLIGHGSHVTGDVNFSGGLRIDGMVSGNVICSDKGGTLIVSEKARVEGRVMCTHLILNGEITGPIEVSHYDELQAKARVKGDLHYKTLEMQPGAVVDGSLMFAGERLSTAEAGQSAD